jgi:hydroxyacylglutathione hydrolase
MHRQGAWRVASIPAITFEGTGKTMSDFRIHFSAIWQTTTTLLSQEGSCIVVDPAYFPREIEEIAALARSMGRLEAIIFTHGHWDHVVGHSAFPGVPVYCSATLAKAIAAGEQKPLDKAREFDSRWYVDRPIPLTWPSEVHGLREGQPLRAGALELRALSLPGHCADALGLLLESEGLLLVGDYLSPCEIPFVNDLDGYRATLRRLLAMMKEEIRTVVPGHGPRLKVNEARSIAQADLAYLDRLAELRRHDDAAAFNAFPLPRAANVIGMREHHLDNIRAALKPPS